MEPPDNAIETTTATVWFDDGIIFSQSNGLPSTSETASEVFDVVRELTGGVPTPRLFDARSWPGGDVGAWTTAVKNLEFASTAVALLVNPGSSAAKGPYLHDRLPVAFRVFTDKAEALAFLQGYLPDE